MHAVPKGTYGAPRVHAELAEDGMRHDRKRVARLIRAAGLAGKSPRRWRATTIADPNTGIRPDLVGRDFTTDPTAVDTRWCGDITYINTWQGWLDLARAGCPIRAPQTALRPEPEAVAIAVAAREAGEYTPEEPGRPDGD